MIRIFYPKSIYKLLDALSKHKVYVVGGFVRDMLLRGHGGVFTSENSVIPGKCERYVTRGGSAQTGDPFMSSFSKDSYREHNYSDCYLDIINGSSVASYALAEDDRPRDVDLVTKNSLETFLPTIQKLSPKRHIMERYQAVQFAFEGYQVTLTRLRYDAICDGRQAQVAFVETLQEDVWRRDFTINALYADCDGQVVDFLGGYQDLAQKNVCFIGDPETRIKEDLLRILRYVRFCSLLETPMDPNILDIMRFYRPHLKSLPSDRLQQEMRKIKKLPLGEKNWTSFRLFM